MNPSILAAGFAAATFLAAAAPAPAQDLLTPQGRITMLPGHSIQLAMTQAAVMRRVAGARPASSAGTSIRATPGAPQITSGALLANTLTVGDPASVPAMQFAYKTGPAGLSGAGFTFTSPNGLNALSLNYYPGAFGRKGTITFDGAASPPNFAQPGQWTLTSAYVGDQNYNFTNYTQAQLAALITNPVIDIINTGPVDFTPPVVTAGKVLTPTVSLSSPVPQFVAQLSGTDDLSGVAFGFIIIEAPGGSFGQTQTTSAPIAFAHGSMQVSAPFFQGQPTGTWSITGFILCDVAQNCSTNVQTPADVQALFGTTTFTVTN